MHDTYFKHWVILLGGCSIRVYRSFKYIFSPTQIFNIQRCCLHCAPKTSLQCPIYIQLLISLSGPHIFLACLKIILKEMIIQKGVRLNHSNPLITGLKCAELHNKLTFPMTSAKVMQLSVHISLCIYSEATTLVNTASGQTK